MTSLFDFDVCLWQISWSLNLFSPTTLHQSAFTQIIILKVADLQLEGFYIHRALEWVPVMFNAKSVPHPVGAEFELLHLWGWNLLYSMQRSSPVGLV